MGVYRQGCVREGTQPLPGLFPESGAGGGRD